MNQIFIRPQKGKRKREGDGGGGQWNEGANALRKYCEHAHIIGAIISLLDCLVVIK